MDAGGLAIVLSGGGARAAYQAGVLRCLGRHFPGLWPAILTGESAGAINAVYMAAHAGSFREASEDLGRLWGGLTIERIFKVDAPCLLRNVGRWGVRLISGGWARAPEVRGLLDTAPLRALLHGALADGQGEVAGLARNLDAGRLQAVALTTIDYLSGQTVTWVQGCGIQDWERPRRRGARTRLTVDHVMASAALPFLFPAVALDGRWHGDGGVRLHAPLSPAVHLGAAKVLAVSTRSTASSPLVSRAAPERYPPPAQIAGVLLDAIFLDLVDQDALALERLNALVRALPREARGPLRPVDLLVLRPSRDLAGLAQGCDACLPRAFRFMVRGLGTREAQSPALLSVLAFEPGYVQRVMELGESDTERQLEALAAFLERPAGE